MNKPDNSASTEVTTTQPLESLYEGPASGEESEETASPDTESVAADSPEETGRTADTGSSSEQQEDPELAALVAKFAKEYGLNDLADPRNLEKIDIGRLIKRLADKEKYILKLKGETTAAQPAVKWDEGLPGADSVTTQRDSAAQQQQVLQDSTQQAQEQTTAPAAPSAADIGAGWRSQSDAITALNEAYAEGDFNKVADVENAMWLRQFTGMAVPYLARLQQAFDTKLEAMRHEFDEVLPDLRASTAKKQFEQDRDFVLSQFKETAFADLIDPLFQEQEGPPVEFNGKEFQNTPYNRLLMENPHLLKIREDDQNSRVAQRKTLYTRMEAVLRLFKKEQEGALGPDKAKELIEAGKEIAMRNGKDRARQGLNAGAGSKQKGGSHEVDYAQHLQELPGFGAVDELFRSS